MDKKDSNLRYLVMITDDSCAWPKRGWRLELPSSESTDRCRM